MIFKIHRLVVCCGLTGLLLAGSAPAAGAGAEKTAGFLFAYYPKEGQRPLFEEGYRRHLEWHRQRQDTLVWYAWDVTSGERTGLFIDGSFGSSFAAFDHRIDVAGDGADFSQTTAPFAEPAFRRVLRLRPGLSTGKPLEEHTPSPHVEVAFYVLHTGMESRFEALLARLREALASDEKTPVYTWYQLVAGGEDPGYMLMIPRRGWSDFDTEWQTLTELIERSFSPEEAAQALEELARSVRDVRRETWRYREDLSYFPES